MCRFDARSSKITKKCYGQLSDKIYLTSGSKYYKSILKVTILARKCHFTGRINYKIQKIQ